MERHSNRVLLEIYKKELEKEIDELLDQLSPRQKEVYILSRENGLTLDEIAARLKISPNTAKNHLVHALRSEEHTSELQSRGNLVCRLLLEKNDKYIYANKTKM